MTKMLYLLPVFILLGCVSETKQHFREKSIYEVLNAAIQVDTLYPRPICQELQEPFHRPTYTRKVMFNGDSVFLNKQLSEWKLKKIGSNKLYFIGTTGRKLVDAIIDTVCNSPMFYRLSYPLFSKDSGLALVTVVEQCEEVECGGGSVIVLRRSRGHWVKGKTLLAWKN